jgi:hypothetical protein
MWLAVNEIVQHDDVIRAIIIRTWSNVACDDSHARDTGVVELDPEKRETTVARRRGNETAVQQTCNSLTSS